MREHKRGTHLQMATSPTSSRVSALAMTANDSNASYNTSTQSVANDQWHIYGGHWAMTSPLGYEFFRE